MAASNRSRARGGAAKRTSTNGNSASAAGRRKQTSTKAAAAKPTQAQTEAAKKAATNGTPPERFEDQTAAVGVLIQIQRTDDIGNFAITQIVPLGGVLVGEVGTICEIAAVDYRKKLGLPTAK